MLFYYYLFSSYHINLSSCYPLSLSLYQWSFHISFPCVLCLLLSPYLPSFLMFISLFPSILPGSIFRCYSSFNSSHFCLFYCCYSMFISYVVSFFQYVFFVFIFHHESFLSPCYSLIPCIVSSIFPINLSLSVSVNMLCYTLFLSYRVSFHPSFRRLCYSLFHLIIFSSFFPYVLCIYSLIGSLYHSLY